MHLPPSTLLQSLFADPAQVIWECSAMSLPPAHSRIWPLENRRSCALPARSAAMPSAVGVAVLQVLRQPAQHAGAQLPVPRWGGSRHPDQQVDRQLAGQVRAAARGQDAHGR